LNKIENYKITNYSTFSIFVIINPYYKIQKWFMKFQSLNVFYQKKFNFIKFNGKIILKAIQQALKIQTRTPNLQA